MFKNHKKVAFDIASEASYVCILKGQKFIKITKNVHYLASFWKPEACGQTVLPGRSALIGQELVKNAKKKIENILNNFQTLSTTEK